MQSGKPPLNSRDFSHEEIRSDFETALDAWTANQDFLEIYDISLECDIDELLLKRNLNQKAYQNISLHVDIFHAPVEMTKEAMDHADEAYNSLYECLYRETTYGKLVYRIEIDRYAGEDKSGGSVGSRQIMTGYSGDQNKVAQPKNELKAQTIAYDYAEALRQKKYLKDGSEEIPYGSPVLTRFGIDSVSGELIVELEMSTPQEEHMEAFRESLDARGKEVCELLVADKKVLEYLKDNNVPVITVGFTTSHEGDDFYYEYRHEV
ncbi:MAG: hypothetical protein IJ374_12260 [Lachnospiraceae bacterium]|nr:hypothetical protein [Lachnospiraceae bacterium]